MSQQNTMLATMRDAAQEGIDATGADTSTARRLHEMQDFYTYMTNELVPSSAGVSSTRLSTTDPYR